ANDPATERLARVHANLVSPARDRTKLDQCGPIAHSEPSPIRCRFGPVFIRNHPPARFSGRLLKQSDVDYSLALRDLATDHGNIIFFDLPRLERTLKRHSRLGTA